MRQIPYQRLFQLGFYPLELQFGGQRLLTFWPVLFSTWVLLKPIGGFCAETGASLSLFLSSWFGLPVSTTHIITGGIVGAGMFKRFSAVHWGVARRIVWAWVITMPAAGAIAALSYFLKTL